MLELTNARPGDSHTGIACICDLTRNGIVIGIVDLTSAGEAQVTLYKQIIHAVVEEFLQEEGYTVATISKHGKQ
jgi:hypothetical protein